MLSIDMFLCKIKGNGPRRNICQKRLSKQLAINKMCAGLDMWRVLNIGERITIMNFTKRH